MEPERQEWPWEYDPEIMVPDMNLLLTTNSKSGDRELWAMYHDGMARIREKRARQAREQAERERAEHEQAAADGGAEREWPAS